MGQATPPTGLVLDQPTTSPCARFNHDPIEKLYAGIR